MRNLMMTLAATAAAIAVSPAAFAQETTADRPFSGIYVGGTFGADVQPNDDNERILFDRNQDGNFSDNVTTAAGANAFSPGFCNGRARVATPIGCDNDRDDIGYGARVGFDGQFGNIVAGVVGEFGTSEITDSVSAFSTTPANYVMARTIDWEANARLRLGYAANTTLFYGTGGIGYAKVDSSFTTTNTANAFAQSNEDMRWGYVFGGGVEQKLGRNFSIGLEYLGHVYKDEDYRVRVTAGSAPATNPFILAPNTAGTDFRRSDDRFRWHSIRATAAFRF